MFKKYHALLFFLFIGFASLAQKVMFLNRQYISLYEKYGLQNISNFHSSFKPYILDKKLSEKAADSIFIAYRTKKSGDVKGFHRKLRYENLIKVDTEDFRLRIDPLFNFEIRKVKGNKQYDYVNTRGASVEGYIGKNFYFYSNFFENQAAFSGYIDSYIKAKSVVPGEPLAKGFGQRGVDYSSANGFISLNLGKYFNVQFGHGKNFIGNGYRSLLLSDNSCNYPYLRITTNVWRLQYTNLYTSFLDIRAPRTYTMGFQKKSGSFHYLSINVGKRLNLGFFEGIIWQNYDSLNTRGIDVNYLNPVIFYRPIEFSLASPDNAIVGFNANYRIGKSFLAYGQLVIDDINLQQAQKGWGFLQNKYGFQLGFVGYDFLGIANLTLRSEYNHVQPYTYAHKLPVQNYAHYNQPLAHPLGANFIESVSFLNYRYKDFMVELKFSYAEKGTDTLRSNWGGDIFKSDFTAQNGLLSFGNRVGQGLKEFILHRDFYISYLINPKTNLNLAFGISSRLSYSVLGQKEFTFVMVALRTSLNNFYFDF